MTKTEFWQQMHNKFATIQDDTLGARQHADGRWELTGGTAESRARYLELAAVAGRANQGVFPPDVHD